MIIEKIRIELTGDKTTSTQNRIGNYLIDRFTNDDVLRAKANEQDVSLVDVENYLMGWAKTKANGSSSIMISDNEVFGELIHAFDEGLIKKEPEQPKREVKAKTPVVKKPKAEQPLGGLFAQDWWAEE